MTRMSPARAHYLRTSAALSADKPEDDRIYANSYELMLLQLAEDKRTLKSIQSIERKVEAKRTLIPKYLPWIEGVLQGTAHRQDDILVTIMVWLLDCGNITAAVPLAEYALQHGLTMPDQYERPLPGVLAEEAAECSLKDKRPDLLDPLLKIEALTAEQDMHDAIRAKLYKAIGMILTETDKPVALTYLERAVTLDPRVGVKKDIERLQRDIKNAPPSAAAAEG